MIIAALTLIGAAAAVELVAGVLFMLHKLSPNPHMPWAMFSGVVFAISGVLLYLGG